MVVCVIPPLEPPRPGNPPLASPKNNMDTAASPGAPASGRSLPFDLRTIAGGTLVLELSSSASFDTLRASMRAELGTNPEKLKGANCRLDLGRREVDLFDLRRLIHLLKDEFGLHVVGLHCLPEALTRLAERELKIKVYPGAPSAEPIPAATVPPTPPPSPSAPALAGQAEEGPTELVRDAPAEEEDGELPGTGKLLTIDGTVRSGAVIRFAGDIQVFGDVNPGAQLIAGGNVLVFGALKGLAHAGARGDITATSIGPVIMAFDMRPTQLRIGKVIQLPSQSPEHSARQIAPEIAWLSGGSIVIEPYRGRLPSPAPKEST